VKFVPYQLLDGRPSVVVDGSPAPGTVLTGLRIHPRIHKVSPPWTKGVAFPRFANYSAETS
jgi:hypothetical protein